MIPRFRDRVGRRGGALLFFAVLGYVYGSGLIWPALPLNASAQWAQAVLPLSVWGAMWVGVGALCTVSAFLHHDDLAFAAVSALTAGWGVLQLAGWALGQADRGYLSAVIWLPFAAFVYYVVRGVEPKSGGRGKGSVWTRQSSAR